MLATAKFTIQLLPVRILEELCAVSNFYGTEIEIWAGFWPVDNTEKKKFGPIMRKFEGGFFMFSWTKKVLSF